MAHHIWSFAVKTTGKKSEYVIQLLFLHNATAWPFTLILSRLQWNGRMVGPYQR